MRYDFSSLIGKDVKLHTTARLHVGEVVSFEEKFVVLQEATTTRIFPMTSVLYIELVKDDGAATEESPEWTADVIAGLIKEPKY